MEYKTDNDYELIYLVRENDEEAYNYMQKKYNNLIACIAKKYYYNNSYLGIEYEDLYQEGLYAFEMALTKYDMSSSLFYTYVTLCIKREIERRIKKEKRYKNMVLTSAYSLNSPLQDNIELTLEETIEDKTIVGNKKISLEEKIISKEITEDLLNFKYELKYPQSAIYELKVNNFNNKEIASLLEITYKDVDNGLRTIRNKLKKYKNKIYE